MDTYQYLKQLSEAAKSYGHRYFSTACYHGEHGNCRLKCKYCPAPCRCTCHATWREDS